MIALVIAGLGLIGVPGTAGFVSKWALLQALMQAELWWLVGVMLISSLLAVAYIWRLIEVIYFQPAPADDASIREAPAGMLLCIAVLALLTIWFGLQAGPVLDYCQMAAARLLGVE